MPSDGDGIRGDATGRPLADSMRRRNITYASFAIVPPALVGLLGFMSPGSGTFILATLAYEAVLLMLGLTSDTWNELRRRWAPRLADAIDHRMQNALSRYTHRVRAYVRDSSSHLEAQGLATIGEFSLTLDDVFVDLALDPAPLTSLNSSPVDYGRLSQESPVHTDLWYWLRKTRKDRSALVIVGPPGSGKTTLIRHLCHALSTRSSVARRSGLRQKLPVSIELRKHAQKFVTGEPDLADIVEAVLSDVSGKPGPVNWVARQLAKGRLVLLLDGLDEVASPGLRLRVATWVERQQEKYGDSQFVVTSRPGGYAANPLARASVLQVRKYSLGQIESYARAWYQATLNRRMDDERAASIEARRKSDDLLRRLRGNANLEDLAANPLLLTMIVNVHHYRGALPGSRASLYQEVCEAFLWRRHEARGIDLDMPPKNKQRLLRLLAFQMMVQRTRDTSPGKASSILGAMLAKLDGSLSIEQFLQSIEATSGVVIERESGVYSFSHLTFQEYLAAEFLKDRRAAAVQPANDLDFAEVDPSDPWWRETLLLYSALDDAVPVIQKCLGEYSADRGALELAILCMKEAAPLVPEARAKLDKILDPSTPGLDEGRRLRASLAQILLRKHELVNLDTHTKLSPAPISVCEYEYFLHALGRPERHVPDHWAKSAPGPSNSRSPILGVRFIDARAFSEWVGGEMGDGATYRLARKSELNSIRGKAALAEHPQPSTSMSISESGSILPVSLTVPDGQTILDAATSQLASDSELLERDWNVLLQAALPHVVVQRIQDRLKFIDEELEVGKLSAPTDFVEWLKSIVSNSDLSIVAQAVDINYIDADDMIASLEKLVELTADPRQRYVGVQGGAMGDLSDARRWLTVSVAALRMALRRDGLAPQEEEDRRNLRLVGRLAVLTQACYMRSIPKIYIAPSRSSARQIRAGRVPSDVTEFPSVDGLFNFYIRLAIMERRTSGDLEPFEGFHIVRQRPGYM